MHVLPSPRALDLSRIVNAHWNKSWAILNTTSGAEMTSDLLMVLAEVGQGSLHFSDGTFEELNPVQTKALVSQFCAMDSLEGTLKLSFGDTVEDISDWRQAFPGAKISLNYFLSTGPASGLRAHFDNHHVFAVQLLGEKVWGLGAKVAVATPEAPSFYPKKNPAIETTIQTEYGSILYIPPGGWHGAETMTRSVHATIGIYPPTYAEYLRQLITLRASSDIVLRSELAPVVADGGLEIGFYAPSLATTKELADRITRVSAINRVKLSSQLEITHKAELTREIEQIVETIWQEAEIYGCVALYLRGSAARPNVSGLQPWDIDLVLVTRQIVPETITRSSREEVAGLELDIRYITTGDLVSAERELPIRLLLRSEGVLLRGQDIVCELPMVKPSSRMAAVIATRQVSACSVNDSILEDVGDNSMMIRRCAKAALRLATPLIMLELGRLERDPMVCGWFIAAHYPDLRSVSEDLLACIRGESGSSATVREMARRLLDGIREDLSKIGGLAGEQQ